MQPGVPGDLLPSDSRRGCCAILKGGRWEEKPETVKGSVKDGLNGDLDQNGRRVGKEF